MNELWLMIVLVFTPGLETPVVMTATQVSQNQCSLTIALAEEARLKYTEITCTSPDGKVWKYSGRR